VPSPTHADHVHLVDGAMGGYAAAAAQLKRGGTVAAFVCPTIGPTEVADRSLRFGGGISQSCWLTDRQIAASLRLLRSDQLEACRVLRPFRPLSTSAWLAAPPWNWCGPTTRSARRGCASVSSRWSKPWPGGQRVGRHLVEEIGQRYVQYLGEFEQSARADAVGAALVFLDLLERQSDSGSNLHQSRSSAIIAMRPPTRSTMKSLIPVPNHGEVGGGAVGWSDSRAVSAAGAKRISGLAG
jgi:hypothetical protein